VPPDKIRPSLTKTSRLYLTQDVYWGGIVGALLGALTGAALIGLIIHGFTIPDRSATHLVTALQGIPGALIGICLVWLEGVRRERVPRTRRD
jgi:hypothetical protein